MLVCVDMNYSPHKFFAMRGLANIYVPPCRVWMAHIFKWKVHCGLAQINSLGTRLGY